MQVSEILFLAVLALCLGGLMGGAGLVLSHILPSPVLGASGLSMLDRVVVGPGNSLNYQFAKAKVVNPDSSEVIRQRFYDSILYPLAGANQLSFFTLPQGQGVTTSPGGIVGSAKTEWDTNMTNASMLPSGIAFLIESIEIRFWPGSSAAANTYTAAVGGAAVVAPAANAAVNASNDVNAFTQAGICKLDIMQKNYLTEFVDAFPTKTGIDGPVAMSGAAAATSVQTIQFLRNCGRPYYVDPSLLLQPAVNFALTIKYPGLVPMPSGFNGRVSIILDGLMSRASQ